MRNLHESFPLVILELGGGGLGLWLYIPKHYLPSDYLYVVLGSRSNPSRLIWLCERLV